MKCLACDADISDFTDTSGEGSFPQEGDLSMCMYCGALAFYTVADGVLGIRRPTGEESRTLILNGEVQQMQQKRRELMKGW